ncbi:MAG: hypothetical protein JNM18_00230 [Planctomycetaceae bacterium]|nr:hypothetical protein [Planctomycetaceae bacterium]
MFNPSSERRLSFTRAELAKATGLCEKTIASHEHPRGNLKFILIGKRGKRYLTADVETWLISLRCDAQKRQGGVT